MEKAVLEIKNVSKYYGKKKVVDNVSLNIVPGEIYGFLGPNGAGKTTTIKMILGLLSIDEGEILVNGYSVKKDFEKAMTYIGGIVENPDTYAYMTGMDNLKLYARIRDVKKDRIDEIVKTVKLEGRIKEKVSKYSLGMKQRLGLGITLLHRPKVLILDEPTNGLDPAGIKELRDILKEISKKDKVAVFVSSHILSEMELMCDKVAVIDNGKIVDTENLDEALNKKNKENEIKYLFEVDNPEKAITIIKEKSSKEAILQEEKILVLSDKEEVPMIVKQLVENDIKIYSLEPKTQSLEDVFFDITKGGANNE